MGRWVERGIACAKTGSFFEGNVWPQCSPFLCRERCVCVCTWRQCPNHKPQMSIESHGGISTMNGGKERQPREVHGKSPIQLDDFPTNLHLLRGCSCFAMF